MVFTLSVRFCGRELSGFAVERLFRFISSIQGGDIDGSGKVSAKSQDEPVQKSLRQMEAEEADTERGGRAARDNGEDISSLHSPFEGTEGLVAWGRYHPGGLHNETSEMVACTGDATAHFPKLHGGPRRQAFLQLGKEIQRGSGEMASREREQAGLIHQDASTQSGFWGRSGTLFDMPREDIQCFFRCPGGDMEQFSGRRGCIGE